MSSDTTATTSSPAASDSERLIAALRDAQSESEQRLADAIRRAMESLSATLLSAGREAARGAVEAQKETLDILRHERDVREAAVAQQERLANRVRTLQAQLLETRAALQASLNAEVAARRELEDLWGSTSWRFTRPLREAGLVLRRALRLRTLLSATPEDPVSEDSLVQGRGVETSRGERGAAGSRAPLSPTGERVLDELRQAVDDRRRH